MAIKGSIRSQIRAARALLSAGPRTIWQSCGRFSIPTIKRAEAQDGPLGGRSANCWIKMSSALEPPALSSSTKTAGAPGCACEKYAATRNNANQDPMQCLDERTSERRAVPADRTHANRQNSDAASSMRDRTCASVATGSDRHRHAAIAHHDRPADDGRLVRRQRQLAAPRRLAPGKEMLRADLMPACHLRHDRARRKRFRDDPPLSALLHRRRRPTPLRISTRPRGAEASTIWSTIYANRCHHGSHLELCRLRWGDTASPALTSRAVGGVTPLRPMPRLPGTGAHARRSQAAGRAIRNGR